jgi:hypothetical protein
MAASDSDDGGDTPQLKRAPPMDPLMGTTEETYQGSKTYYYAFGGIPKSDWSGLQDKSKRLCTDLCFRSLDPIAGQKSALVRQTGLGTKYDKDQKLSEFQKKIWTHLVKFGLDTIGYLPDPRNNMDVQSVVTYHARFTGDLPKSIKASKDISKLFDKWDIKHDYEAKEFLLDSLSNSLKASFETFYEMDDSFAITWLKLVHHLVTTTSKTYDTMKAKIRNMRPQQFQGQNIELMGSELIRLAEELDNAGHFDHSLTINMVDGFLSASQDSKGTFHHKLNNLRDKVHDKRQETLFLPPSDQDEVFAKANLTFKDICLQAMQVYKDLDSNNAWEPSKLPKDRQAPAINLTSTDLLPQVLQLIESVTGSSPSKKNTNNKQSKPRGCFNCGDPDHVIKDCPKPKMTEQQAKEKRHSTMSKWKLTAPKAGEPNVKVVNGRTFKWCAKCNNWTTSHDTSTHTGSSSKSSKFRHKGKPKPSSTPETNLSVWEPSAWIVEADTAPTLSPSVFTLVFMYTYLVVTTGLYISGCIKLDTFELPFFSVLQSTTYTILQYIQLALQYVLPYASTTVAPILWFVLGYLARENKITPNIHVQDLASTSSRSVRTYNRKPKRKVKKKSARDFNLVSSYPLRLRKHNIFNRRCDTPTISDRELNKIIDACVRALQIPIVNDFDAHTHNKHNVTISPSVPTKPSIPVKEFVPMRPYRPPHRRGWNAVYNGDPEYLQDLRRDKSPSRSNKPSSKSVSGDKTSKSAGSTSSNDSSSCSWYTNCKHTRNTCKPTLKPSDIPTIPKYSPRARPKNKTSKHRKQTTKKNKSKQTGILDIYVAGASSPMSKTLAQKVSLLAPSCFKTAINESKHGKSFTAIIDTGASICVSPDKNDFLDYKPTTDINSVKGLGGKQSKVIGQGTVRWSVHDTTGNLRHFELHAYHIPTSKSRLISTHVLLKTYKGERLIVYPNSMELSGVEGIDTRASVIAYNDPRTNLPTLTAYSCKDLEYPMTQLCHAVSTVQVSNHNLSESQKELLRWHQRLGHIAFRKAQHLLRTGVLSYTEASRKLHTAASKITEMPKCAACLFGKQTVRSAPGTTTRVVKDRAGVLRAGNLLPGSEVSVDHFVSSVKGRLFTGYDKGAGENKYVGGCIFVDHASSYIHVEHQVSLSSHETLRAKLAFENMCRDVGVVVLKYMSDNGTAFTSQDYSNHLAEFHQVSKFAGVGAHHHNAQAERAIRTIMSIARTMMIHSGIHWPEVAKSSLWPMAVTHACYIFNHVPSTDTGLSPSDIFTKTRWPQKKFHDLHVWGCPTYILDKTLQDGKKLPKWKPRSERGVYMGVSTEHASSVPIVLRVSTGSITPQFHVVFDDWFATVAATAAELPDFASDEWYKMFGNSTYQYVLDSSEEEQSPTDSEEAIAHDQNSSDISQLQEAYQPAVPLQVPEPALEPRHQSTGSYRAEGGGSTQQLFNDTASSPSTSISTKPEISQNSTPINTPNESPDITPTQVDSPKQPSTQRKPSTPPNPIPVRKSKRASKPAPRLTYTHDKKSLTHLANLTITDSHINHYENITNAYPDAEVLLTSKAQNNPDMFEYSEAMNGEHRKEWIEAATKEIRSLEELKCWEEIPLASATTKVLPGTWVFRVKRAPDGSFKKFKARYCIRGDLQEGEFETYAPVVHFSSVRLFLAWSLMFNWETCCVDFSNAFIQASLENPTFIHLPRGFNSSMKQKSCLRLKKSLYGLSVAPRLWFQHLLKALKGEGIKQTKQDPCLMYRKDLIIICHVDDLGIQSPKKEVIDELLDALQKKGFQLTREGTFSEYLGIQYTHNDKNGSINMTQEGLIQKIIEATGMEDCNPNHTPAIKDALGSDPDGEPMTDSWSYRSIVGMLLYLSTNTRPDIAYAVSQVARFSHYPKKSHATAIKTIVRYLAGTKDKGMIYSRPKELALECFVDADFAGLFGKEPAGDPVSAKSRTGYIISVGGCCISAKSQLQSTIALSTSEAEYGALSQAMRMILPIREAMIELIEHVEAKDDLGNFPFGPRDELLKFKTTIHEDNSAALSLALNQKVTSRTKHWNVKLHFFWSHVNDKDKRITCVKVDTKLQRADYLTKGLTRELFENCRQLNQGW